MGEIWSGFDERLITNEASVELHVVLPLLESLGYSNEDIAPKHAVIRREGRGRKPEADFVVFYGAQRTKSNSLITVEAKSPGESFDEAKMQGESYAQAIGTPFLLVTDGRLLEIWQLQLTSESECVLKCSMNLIGANRAGIEALLSREAAYAFCKTLQHKGAFNVAVDISTYLHSEQVAHNDATQSFRRLLRVGAQEEVLVAADQVQARFEKGAIITGASGFGKSTLASQFLRQSIAICLNGQIVLIPCLIQLADLAASKHSIVAYVHARIHAHCPAIGMALLEKLMRERRFTLFCDGFDRLIPEHARVIEAAIREMSRDYPRSQIFIFTRPGALPDLAIPELSLQPLNDSEQKAFLELRFPGDFEADNILRGMPQSLFRLANHPLLLARIASYWQAYKAYPSGLATLFESWLDQLLASRTQPISHLMKLRQGMTVLAVATFQSPIPAMHALALFAAEGIRDTVLDELVLRNAVQSTGITVELHHEALADYLRALDIVSSSERFDKFLARPLENDESLFPVLLMAMLPNRKRQTLLWEKLAQTSLTTYLEALRFRANLVSEFDQQDIDGATEAYLTDVLNGIDELSRYFFPQLSQAILRQLTGHESGDLVISGALVHDRQWIKYQIDVASGIASPRVTVGGVGRSEHTSHGVNLKMSDLRIDSGRMLGATRLLESLCEIVEARNLKGRQEWITERLLGRIRFLEKKFWHKRPCAYGLQELHDLLAPDADKILEPLGFSQLPSFTVQMLLDDIRWLLEQGQETIMPWWLPHVDPLTLTPRTEEQHQCLLHEHFRRIQLIYVEVCEESFHEFANEFGMYCAMPIRWEVKLTPRAHGRAMHYRWRPVAEWPQAGADVTFVDELPADFFEASFQEVDRKISNLGRRSGRALSLGGAMAQIPRLDGSTWQGNFDGETSVMHEVGDWLKSDLKRLFRSLPTRDSGL